MARRVAGITESLLESAQSEFLAKGYQEASLRSIAEKAGCTKGAVYSRYPDKESLYRAVVEPCADEFCELLHAALKGFQDIPADRQAEEQQAYADDGFPRVIDYIYDHFDTFKVLLSCGESTVAQEFLHRLVDIDLACTMAFIDKIGSDAVTSGRLTPDLAHILSYAFYSGLFEVVMHDMGREQANERIAALREFYGAGWSALLEGTHAQ